jgi:RNA polymerase sigma-70 factor (ECF subfamily)
MATVTGMGSDYARRHWPEVAWFILAPGRGNAVMIAPRAYGEMADEALLTWSAQGDRRAFDEIVTRHGPFALRVAMRVLSDPLLAEDVVQDAMLRAWSQAGRFDPDRARFTTWLYRIVVNLCIDQKRRVGPDPIPEDFDAVDPAAGTDEMMEASERQAALVGALRTLPARQRVAMALVYDEGLSGAEAARILGLSAKAVERLLARARTYLREQLLPERGFRETGT